MQGVGPFCSVELIPRHGLYIVTAAHVIKLWLIQTYVDLCLIYRSRSVRGWIDNVVSMTKLPSALAQRRESFIPGLPHVIQMMQLCTSSEHSEQIQAGDFAWWRLICKAIISTPAWEVGLYDSMTNYRPNIILSFLWHLFSALHWS